MVIKSPETIVCGWFGFFEIIVHQNLQHHDQQTNQQKQHQQEHHQQNNNNSNSSNNNSINNNKNNKSNSSNNNNTNNIKNSNSNNTNNIKSSNNNTDLFSNLQTAMQKRKTYQCLKDNPICRELDILAFLPLSLLLGPLQSTSTRAYAFNLLLPQTFRQCTYFNQEIEEKKLESENERDRRKRLKGENV